MTKLKQMRQKCKTKRNLLDNKKIEGKVYFSPFIFSPLKIPIVFVISILVQKLIFLIVLVAGFERGERKLSNSDSEK
jgi:hypothetical protein